MASPSAAAAARAMDRLFFSVGVFLIPFFDVVAAVVAAVVAVVAVV